MSELEMKEPLKKNSHKPEAEQNAPTTAEGSHREVLRLQRLLGNQALQRRLADNSVSISQRTGPTIQAKLTVGAADDPYEREADAVADHVMAKRDSIQRTGDEDELQMKRVQREGDEDELQMKRVQREGDEDELQMKRVQREGDEDELQMKRVQREGDEDELQMKRVQREEDEDELQMKRVQRVNEEQVDMSGSFDVNNDVESRIGSKSGSGQSIPEVHREMFESSIGADFSGVNIHTDAESDSLNRELGARAFTTGSDIFFRQGEYNPGSSDGQRLLAHELTHVVQQGAAGVHKKAEED